MLRKTILIISTLALSAAAQEPVKPPQRVTISAELLQTVVNYLGTQPYQNVAQLIQAIQQDVKPVEDKKSDSKK